MLKPDVWREVQAAYDQGWTIRKQGHALRLYCPCGASDGTIVVPGSPRNAGNAARRIRQDVARCPERHPSVSR